MKKDKVLEALKVLNRQQPNQEETESPEQVHFKAEQVLKFTPQKNKTTKTLDSHQFLLNHGLFKYTQTERGRTVDSK